MHNFTHWRLRMIFPWSWNAFRHVYCSSLNEIQRCNKRTWHLTIFVLRLSWVSGFLSKNRFVVLFVFSMSGRNLSPDFVVAFFVERRQLSSIENNCGTWPDLKKVYPLTMGFSVPNYFLYSTSSIRVFPDITVCNHWDTCNPTTKS